MSLNRKSLGILVAMTFMTCSIASQAHDKSKTLKKVQTPTTRTGLLQALRDGHIKVFGTAPSDNRLAMAWGQVAFENGQGRLSFNHNLGNVASAHADTPAYFNPADRHYYRAFDTFADGAAAYWEVIQRCSAALVHFDKGNAVAAAARLKRCGYFEADLDDYTRGFATLFNFAQRTVLAEEQHERRQREEAAAAELDATASASYILNPGSDRQFSW